MDSIDRRAKDLKDEIKHQSFQIQHLLTMMHMIFFPFYAKQNPTTLIRADFSQRLRVSAEGQSQNPK